MHTLLRATSEASLQHHLSAASEASRGPHHRRGGGTPQPLQAPHHSRSESRLTYTYRGWCVSFACACACACACVARARRTCPPPGRKPPGHPGPTRARSDAARRAAPHLRARRAADCRPRDTRTRAAWCKPQGQSAPACSSPCGYPPLQRRTRSLGAALGSRRELLPLGCRRSLWGRSSACPNPPILTAVYHPGGIMMLLVVATDDPVDLAAGPPAAAGGAHRLPSTAAAAMISQLTHAAGAFPPRAPFAPSAPPCTSLHLPAPPTPPAPRCPSKVSQLPPPPPPASVPAPPRLRRRRSSHCQSHQRPGPTLPRRARRGPPAPSRRAPQPAARWRRKQV